MHILQGFRTLIFNVVAIAATWLANEYGIILSEEHQTAITVTIVSLTNIALRSITKTPICRKKSKQSIEG